MLSISWNTCGLRCPVWASGRAKDTAHITCARFVINAISLYLSLSAAHPQNAVGRRRTDNLAAIGAKNAGTSGQSLGAACLCGLVQAGNG